jgi:hypothetical protein
MSDSAATRKQLKIKSGVVKRFVALHVVICSADVETILSPQQHLDARKI